MQWKFCKEALVRVKVYKQLAISLGTSVFPSLVLFLQSPHRTDIAEAKIPATIPNTSFLGSSSANKAERLLKTKEEVG